MTAARLFLAKSRRQRLELAHVFLHLAEHRELGVDGAEGFVVMTRLVDEIG
jgi:hypothetical protein